MRTYTFIPSDQTGDLGFWQSCPNIFDDVKCPVCRQNAKEFIYNDESQTKERNSDRDQE